MPPPSMTGVPSRLIKAAAKTGFKFNSNFSPAILLDVLVKEISLNRSGLYHPATSDTVFYNTRSQPDSSGYCSQTRKNPLLQWIGASFRDRSC